MSVARSVYLGGSAMRGEGFFVAIEGIDGAGKSTLARQLGPDLVRSRCQALILTKESRPEDPFGRGQLDGIGRALWDYPRNADIAVMGDPYWLGLLAAWFTAVDRFLVQPALTEGRLVVSDGWVAKYVARFALKPQFEIESLTRSFAAAATPDMTLWLDLPPAIASGRRSDFKPSESGQAEAGRGQLDFTRYQTMVAANLSVMARQPSWQRINGTAPPNAVLDQARRAITATMGALLACPPTPTLPAEAIR
jgi:dTMP kinase